MFITILTTFVLLLLATVLILDLKRHLELIQSKKRLMKSADEFFKSLDEAIEKHEAECDCDENVEINIKEMTEEEAKEAAKSENLKEISIVKVQVPKKKGDFKRKLSAAQIKEIEKAPFSITHRALAVKYGVSEGRIGQIRRGAKVAKK